MNTTISNSQNEVSKQLVDILERISDGFVAFDAHMNYTYVNTKGGELLGRKPKDLIGKNYWKEFLEAKGTPFANAYVKAFETQTPIVLEDYYAPWDRWFENRIYPSKEGLSIFFQDITERRRTEKALVDSASQWKTTFDVVTDGICLLDPEHRIVRCNNAMMDLFLKSAADMIGKCCWEVVHGTNEPIPECPIIEMKKTLQRESVELKLADRWFDVTVDPIFDAENNLSGAVHIVRDITKRKLAELASKRAEDALRESKLRLEMAIQASNTGFWDWNLISNEVYFSPEWKKQIGYEDHEISNDFFEWQSRVHADDLERSVAMVNSFIKNPWPNYELEFRFRHKDGSYRWMLAKASILKDIEGKPYRMLGSHIDITERKRAEEALRALSSRQQALLAAVPEIIMEVDFNKVYTWANKAGIEFFGDDVIGKEAACYFEEEQDTYTAVQPLFSGSEDVFYVESWQRRKDGQKRLLAWWCQVLKDQSGNVRGALSSARDITDRKQAEEVIQQKSKDLAILLEVSQKLTTTLEMETILQNIIDRATNLIGLDTGAIYLIKGDELYLGATTPTIPPEFPEEFRHALLIDHPHIHQCVSTGKPVVLPDLMTSHLSPAEQTIRDSRKMRSLLYVPLLIENRAVGVLIVGTQKKTRSFSESEINLYRTMSGQAALVIENAKLFQESKITNEELQTINKIITTSTSILDTKEMLDKILAEALEIAGLEGGTVCLIEPDDTLKLVTQRENSEATIRDLTENRIKIGDCLCGNCAHDNCPLILWNREDVLRYATREVLRGEKIDFHAAFPFTIKDKCVGVLCVFTRTDKKPTERNLKLLETLTAQVALAIENVKLFEHVKQSAEQLRALSARLQSIREEERTAIAREIHDNLGQALTGLKMDLAWISKKAPDVPKDVLKKRNEMMDLIDGTIQSVRRISSELRPGILDDLGLVAAIEWQAKEFERRSHIKCRIKAETAELDIERDRATALFRIFQEALTNVARHAEATRVTVELKKADGTVELSIRDNGKGIAVDEIQNVKSLGLVGMRERAAAFGGKVTIEGMKGKGTRVQAQMPMR